MERSRLTTVAVSAGRPSGAGEALNHGIIPASAFVLGGERAYSRDDGTPTWAALEAVVGALEDAEAVAFSSGMAAIAAVFELVPAGGRVVWPDDCYQGVAALIAAGEASGRWTSVRLPVDATDRWCVETERADLIWVESPSNPLLVVADVRAIGAVGRHTGAILAVDNTLAGPIAQQPLDVGADVSVQSTTKHLGGHSDLLGGVATTRDPEVLAALRHQREIRGATPGALESFLAVRGIRTYPLRAAAASASAAELARRLAEDPRVEVVRYPGVPSHGTHEVAAAQLASFGSVISFDVAGGAERADRACAALEVVIHATSFGAVESTMERRAAVPGQEHLPPGLLRLSVGIEDVEDIWADLDRALGDA